MAVITIRHEFATGGRELSRRITDKVNYRFVDKCLFQKIPANKVKKTIAERDANQNWFNKAIYQDDYNERFLYHVTINMENGLFDRAAQIVCAAAGLLHHDLSGNLTGWINS